MKAINLIALTLVIIGGLNWLLVGLFQFDVVAYLFGGPLAPMARIVYALVGIAALYCISFYRHFSMDDHIHHHVDHPTVTTRA